MRSLSSLGIGLSLVFGCLLLALVAELYYLLWWKKRISNREIEDDYSNSGREFFYMFCWKKPSSLSSTALNPQQFSTSGRITDESENQLHLHSKDFLLKPFDENDVEMETELMRLHNLAGPPRFLFTIKEETKEDLESEDGKSNKGKEGSKGRSLSDLVLNVEMDTPFLTPLSSPPFFTPPLTPMDCYNHRGFNPLFESGVTDAAEVVDYPKSSPPPKFMFLKNAEEKFRRTLMEETERKMKAMSGAPPPPPPPVPPPPPRPTTTTTKDEEEGSYITILVEKEQQNHNSSSSQVLPLSSSPSTISKTYKKLMFH